MNKYEYKNPFMHVEWQPLDAHDDRDASAKILALGPYGEDVVIREVGTERKFKPIPVYGFNAGKRCDVATGPCSCGAWH